MQRIVLTGGNRDVVLFSGNSSIEPLPGIFTVNDSGKKVNFSPGYLFWNGSKFGFEEHQYDYPTSWNPNHVGHFFWSKNAAEAHKETYVLENLGESDILFAADDGAVDGYTVLSRDEWDYLIKHFLAKNSSDENVFIVAGKKCVILKPDGFAGTIADSYSVEEWGIAEASGLVALPLAGYRFSSDFGDIGSYGYFWSATLDGRCIANYAIFDDSVAFVSNSHHFYGYCVRLVSVQ